MRPCGVHGFLRFVCGGMALLVERIEDRFIGTEDLERALGLPVLGLVPRLRGKQRHGVGRMADTDRFGHGAEAFAGIRAKIMTRLNREIRMNMQITLNIFQFNQFW